MSSSAAAAHQVLLQLRRRVLEMAAPLLAAARVAAEVDALLSLARAAHEHRLARPILTTDGALRISGGRHLPLEVALARERLIANDTRMDADAGRVHVITGARALRGWRLPSPPREGARLTRRLALTHAPPAAAAGAGPNGSGKSVYLAQVAVIVVLAHVGAYVPADAATVGVCDRVFTRLAGVESASATVQQSAFMRDLHQARRRPAATTPAPSR